jgi:transcription initiation factor TFIID subunit 5
VSRNPKIVLIHADVNNLVGDETKIRIFDLAAGQQLIDLKNHTASIRSLCWSANSKKLMSGCTDGSFYIWNVNNVGLR